MAANSSVREVVRKPYNDTSSGSNVAYEFVGFGENDDNRVQNGTPTIDRTVVRKPYNDTSTGTTVPYEFVGFGDNNDDRTQVKP